MILSQRTLDTLMDLVENRISCMEVAGREDMRELAYLHRCRAELHAFIAGGASGTLGAPTVRRRGRPPKSAQSLAIAN
jgi:hypothetical protein